MNHLRVIDRFLACLIAQRLEVIARIRVLEEAQGASTRQTANTIANLTRCSNSQAAGEITLAQKLAALPELARAHRDGEISNGQLAAAADIATPESQKETIEFAKTASVSKLERQAAVCRGRLAEERQQALATRFLSFKPEGQSSIRLHGRLPYLEATELEQQLRKIADRLELGSPKRSAPSARMADALLVLTNNNPSAALHEHERSRSSSTESPRNDANATPPKSKLTIPAQPVRPPKKPSEFPLSNKANNCPVIDYDKDPFPEPSDDTGSENYGNNDNYGNDFGNDLDDSDLDDSDLDSDLDLDSGVEHTGQGCSTGQEEPGNPLRDVTPSVVVHKSDTRIIIHWNAATGEVNMENGPPIDHPRLQALLCDARIDIQHIDESNVLTGRINTAYHANWRQDRYLAHRDGVCRYPDCPGIGKTQAHHLFEDRADRVTCVTKMINLCNRTHNEAHDGNLQISGDPEGVITFKHTDGRQVRSPAHAVPPRLRPKATPFQKTQPHPKLLKTA